MGYTMRYQEELRDPAEYFKDIKKVAVNEDSLELAMELIKRKAAKFNPAEFKDGYEAAVRELVEAKIKHAPIPQDEVAAPRRGQVVNLMDALRKSVGGAETTRAIDSRQEAFQFCESIQGRGEGRDLTGEDAKVSLGKAQVGLALSLSFSGSGDGGF